MCVCLSKFFHQCYIGRGHLFSPDEYGIPHNGLDVAERIPEISFDTFECRKVALRRGCCN